MVADGRTLTYAELDRTAASCARRLSTLGVGAGNVVATTLTPGLAFCELLHALPKLGAALAPLDPRAPAPTPGLVLSATPTAPEAEVELRERVDPEAVHTVIRSSGTTGTPKSIQLTYANHRASAVASADALGVDPGDRWLCPLPLHHVGGLGVLIRSVINRTTAVVHERFEVERVKAALEGGEATLVSLVPTMLARLREAGLRETPNLRAVALGGGPAAPDLLEWAARTGIPVTPVYGMTETASQVVAGVPGRALAGVELRSGADGEVLIRGPMVAAGALAADGWLHTGDRGSLDGDGRLRARRADQGPDRDGWGKGGAVPGGGGAHDASGGGRRGGAGPPRPGVGRGRVGVRGPARRVDPEELRAWCRARLAPTRCQSGSWSWTSCRGTRPES